MNLEEEGRGVTDGSQRRKADDGVDLIRPDSAPVPDPPSSTHL